MSEQPSSRLGDLERALMDHLWAADQQGEGALTVRQVHDQVGIGRGLAYTTVLTVLDRLAKKGLLLQQRDGRAYRYRPVATREELTASALRSAFGGLDRDDRQAAIMHFIDDATPDELDDLRAALDRVRAGRR
jgi:predicted transcriptional regulator